MCAYKEWLQKWGGKCYFQYIFSPFNSTGIAFTWQARALQISHSYNPVLFISIFNGDVFVMNMAGGKKKIFGVSFDKLRW